MARDAHRLSGGVEELGPFAEEGVPGVGKIALEAARGAGEMARRARARAARGAGRSGAAEQIEAARWGPGGVRSRGHGAGGARPFAPVKPEDPRGSAHAGGSEP